MNAIELQLLFDDDNRLVFYLIRFVFSAQYQSERGCMEILILYQMQ